VGWEIPFDFAQGRLSRDKKRLAQDDKLKDGELKRMNVIG
jgi:hypothetical protein